MPMTPEQQKLVNDNLALVGFTLRKMKVRCPPGIDREDLYQAGCVGLCKAAKRYDKGTGNQFSTYAVRCVQSEILLLIRHETAACRDAKKVLSLDRLVADDGRGSLSFAELLAAPGDVDTQAEALRAARELLRMEGREGELLRLAMEGRTQREIGRITGLSQAHVSRLLRRARARLQGKEITRQGRPRKKVRRTNHGID